MLGVPVYKPTGTSPNLPKLAALGLSTLGGYNDWEKMDIEVNNPIINKEILKNNRNFIA